MDNEKIEKEYVPRHAGNGNDSLKLTRESRNIDNYRAYMRQADNLLSYRKMDSADELSKEYSEVKSKKVLEKRMKKNSNIPSNNQINKKNPREKTTKIKRKKTVLKPWVWTMFLIFFLTVVALCIIKLFFWNNDNKKTTKIIDNIVDKTEVEEKDDEEKTVLVNEEKDKKSDYWYYITFPLIDVDIDKLKKTNSDTVGWINVNNTNINYPVVQTKNNKFYLNHSFDKKYNEAGWVFMDYRNKDINNKNTIIYAHSRLDKTMFGSLSTVFKSSWYKNKDNHIIRLSTTTENTLWQIFSVYKIEEESYYIKTDFNDDSEYTKFLNTLKERSIYDFKTSLTKNDRILTLSTCYSEDKRTVVHAKLIKRSSKE